MKHILFILVFLLALSAEAYAEANKAVLLGDEGDNFNPILLDPCARVLESYKYHNMLDIIVSDRNATDKQEFDVDNDGEKEKITFQQGRTYRSLIIFEGEQKIGISTKMPNQYSIGADVVLINNKYYILQSISYLQLYPYELLELKKGPSDLGHYYETQLVCKFYK